MKITADANCYLTEVADVSLDERSFRSMVIADSPEDAARWRQITAEEKASLEAQQAIFENQDITPEYLGKVDTLLKGIKKSINDVEMSDEEVVKNKSFYPTWDDAVGNDLQQGFKFSCDGSMYEVLVPHHATEDMRPTSIMALSAASETENKVEYYRNIGG